MTKGLFNPFPKGAKVFKLEKPIPIREDSEIAKALKKAEKELERWEKEDPLGQKVKAARENAPKIDIPEKELEVDYFILSGNRIKYLDPNLLR